MWLAAIAAVGVILVGPVAAAWAAYAKPDYDAITPTNNYEKNGHCKTGLLGTICRTDNNTVTYYMDSNGEYELETVDRNFVTAAIAKYRDNVPVFSITYDSTPAFDGVSETDIIYQEGTTGAPDSVVGVTWCDDAVDGTDWKCDQQYIRMRGAGRINAKVAAHETGHAFGLLHGHSWDPTRLDCADVVGIMRSDEACMDNANLGGAVINNLNYWYQ